MDPERAVAEMRLIGRMHGAGWYARTTELFEMKRIKPQDWPV